MESGNTSPWPSGFGTRPWLIQAHGRRRETQTFVDMLDWSLHEVTIPEMQGKICLGCVYDGSWLLMLDEATYDCFLLSVTNWQTKIPLPLLRLTSEYKGTCGVLGSPPNLTVVIASNPESEQNFLLYCRPGDDEWTNLLVENDAVILKIDGDIVAYAGKLYASAFTGDDLVVIDVIDGLVQMQLHSTEKEEAFHSMSYLVESCGNLFTVQINFFGNPYDGAVTRMFVYRLDFSDTDWVWRRVDSIGSDRAFLFSGDYCLSCSATAAQLQGYCIYLVWSSCDCERLYKYCLDDMTIRFSLNLPRLPVEHTGRFLLSAAYKLQSSKSRLY